VLAELLRVLPQERYVYFGDNANAPYGSKNVEQIQSLSMKAADRLLQRGVKCLVIACNTATSAAVSLLRSTLSIPVVAMEPAVKPAVEMGRHGAVLVMATPLTLRETKFRTLAGRFSTSAEIVPVPCDGLVELIESGHVEGAVIRSYLLDRLGPFLERPVAAVVLGCTHYVFVRDEVAKVVGEGVPVVHGNEGTARHLRLVLEQVDLLRKTSAAGGAACEDPSDRVEILSSAEPERFAELCLRLLSREMDRCR
jgi:glutamate racemase